MGLGRRDGAAAGLLGEVAGLTRGGRAGGPSSRSRRGERAPGEKSSSPRLSQSSSSGLAGALAGAAELGRSGGTRCRCRSPLPVSRGSAALRPSATVAAGSRPRRNRVGQLPAVAGPWGFLVLGLAVLVSAMPIGPGLRRSRNRSRLSCRVTVRRLRAPARARIKLLACTSNLGARADPRARPGGRRQSSIGPMTEFRVRARDRGARCTHGAEEVLPRGQARRAARSSRQARCGSSSASTRPRPTSTSATWSCSASCASSRQPGTPVVLIIGDYTARVGDPSGRSAQRPVLDARGDRRQRQDLPGPGVQGARPRRAPRSASTASGCDMPAAGAVRAAGARSTVARLLERDDFSKRMAADQPISALELLYPVLQGYDSVAVERRRRARRDRPEVQPAVRPRRPARLRRARSSRS